MSTDKMTASEKRAVFSLAAIMSLRMMGLFMVLPIFVLHAKNLQGATPFLIGLAMGIYGLSQAVLQIPFGSLSDVLGRKPIIAFGLLIFILGSLLAAAAHTIEWLILARCLQGAGAVGGTLLALVADLTRENQRTKSMAIAGISIGFSFSAAVLLGPLLASFISVRSLFVLAGLLGLAAIFLLYKAVPTPHTLSWHRNNQPEFTRFLKLMIIPELANLNAGIFILHAIFTASFIAIPVSLQQVAHQSAAQQWVIYLPALLLAFTFSFLIIGYAEKKQRNKFFFLGSIVMLAISEVLFLFLPRLGMTPVLAVSVFFMGFSLLEAFLPSLVSRNAPAAAKGSALGLYSSAQFLGIFVGGVSGGFLYGQYGLPGVYSLCIFLSLIWLAFAFYLRFPPHLINEVLPLSKTRPWEDLVKKLKVIPGVVEVVVIAEDGIAYLKMEKEASKHPDFIKIKQKLYTAPFTTEL